jgi:hypothetical protein
MVTTVVMMRCFSLEDHLAEVIFLAGGSIPNVRGTAVAQLLQSWSLQTAGYRRPFAVESPFCNTVSPGGGPKHFPTSITNKL